jgi:hypothetical protein
MQPGSSLFPAASPPGRHLDLLATGAILRHLAQHHHHHHHHLCSQSHGAASLLANGPAIPVRTLGNCSNTSGTCFPYIGIGFLALDWLDILQL